MSVKNDYRDLKKLLAKMDKDMREADNMIPNFLATVMKDAGESK
jgi:hypothetical protein